MNTLVIPTIVQPGTGKELRASGGLLVVMLGSEPTAGTLTVMFDMTRP